MSFHSAGPPPRYGQEPYRQEPYGQPTYGQPTYGQPTSGQPPQWYAPPPPAPPTAPPGPPAPLVPPPHPAPSSRPGRPAPRLRPGGNVETALGVLLAANALAALPAAVTGFLLFRELPPDAGLMPVGGASAYGSYDLNSFTGVIQGALLLVTAAVFTLWFHRVRVNAGLFEPYRFRHGAGWAAGGWYVPVVCWWLPFRTALGIWAASGPPPAGTGRPPASVAPVAAWWFLWVSAEATALLALGARLLDQDVPHWARTATGLALAEDVLLLPAAVLALVFVRKVSAMQQARLRLAPAGYVPVG
ncbi:DUF4328 domain-containing protein [Streptomyces sp. NPDC012888]|uniref:DUF4328 domain-containing protein n=1 Tax=Streptomyces sp. NPDC012888 TaxID=3364855 RepID=UPI003691CF41